MRSGYTPLLRARKLEKELGVKEIFLKLEGQNPSGHKHDRIAEVLIKDALAHQHKRIIVNGSRTYIEGIRHYADLESVEILIPIFKNERWKSAKYPKDMLIDLKTIKANERNDVLMQVAHEKKAYLAAEGYTNTHISQMVLEQLTQEIVSKLSNNLDSIYTQLGYGYTLTSIYNVLLKKWMNNDLDNFPKVFSGTWEKGNTIFNEYVKLHHLKDSPISTDENVESIQHQMLMDKKLLEESLRAVSETAGDIISVSKDDLKKAVKLLKKTEHIQMSETEAYALASFIKRAKEGKIEDGRHVIILNDGKSLVTITNIQDFDEVTKEELINYTKTWLAQYSDSTLETQDAIQNAIDRGFVLLASRNGNYEGVCIVVNTGFDEFIPSYHLAYIGTHETSKGRGVGSELIQRAIDLSGGSLSLHVDLDNKGAKKLYEKYGFKHVYNRMIYYGIE